MNSYSFRINPRFRFVHKYLYFCNNFSVFPQNSSKAN